MIRYDHYTDKFVKVSDRECPWCKAVCASTDKYCHECGWHIADTPQTEDDYLLELMDKVNRGEISDATANQVWYEYINKQTEISDTPQTERHAALVNIKSEDNRPLTDCGWANPEGER